jgi:hypothetical protein
MDVLDVFTARLAVPTAFMKTRPALTTVAIDVSALDHVNTSG